MNPPPRHETGVVMKRWTALLGVVAFGGFLSLPWLFAAVGGNLSRDRVSTSPTLTATLQSIEVSVSDQPLFESWRRRDQARLVRFFREGNAKVMIGGNQWMHYRADLDAVIGKGPFYREPPSVARAPGLKPWNEPLPVILEFARQLEERGIELVLVPVPTKPMLFSLEGASRRVIPDYFPSFIRELEEGGIKVIDLFPALDREESYLPRDTHWTPTAMAAAAQSVAAVLQGKSNGLPTRERHMSREAKGDLVGMLDLPPEQVLFGREAVKLTQILDEATGELISSDPDSTTVVLGDSFVNIYEDPSLGFGDEDGARIGAGFASHLAAAMGERLHVIAMNGDGASGVRQAFAALPDDVVRKKERVIWVLSARDLLLSEIPGRRARLRWDRVVFNEEAGREPVGSGIIEMTAVLREKSFIGDPTDTPYTAAVYSTLFDSIEVVRGDFAAEEAFVFHWAFQDRQLSAAAGLEVGKRYRLSLSPFPLEGPVAQATLLDDLFREDLDRVFATAISPIE